MWLEGVRGGNMKHGLLSGLASAAGGSLIEKYGSGMSRAVKVAANAVIGGTAEELGGGKFANGAITGAFSMLFNDLMHQEPPEKEKKDMWKIGELTYASDEALKQYIAIVAGESGNDLLEAAGIGSVIMNRLNLKKATLTGDFVSLIGGVAQYDAIGGKIYNEILNSTWEQILNPANKYVNRIIGALLPLYHNKDYSNGAYFWNASNPKVGFNWNSYSKGTFSITTTIGQTTFFKYSNSGKKWP